MAVDADVPATPPADSPIDLAGGDLVPGWLRRLAALAWRILAVLAMGFLLVSIAVTLSTVTASIIFAALVAASVAPTYRYVRTGRGWAATKAAAILCIVALSALALSVLVIVLTFAPFVGQLVTSIQAGVTGISTFLTDAGLPDEAVALVGRSIAETQEWITGALAGLIGSIANAGTVVILGGFLTFYVLHDYDRAWSMVIRDLDRGQQAAVTQHGAVALDRVSGYLRGSAVDAGFNALVTWVYLQLLGVPLASPLAIVVFLGGFVPYIGTLVTSSVVLLVTIASKGVVDVVLVLALMIATSILRRRLLKGSVERPMPTHPALVFIALPAGAALFGLIGLAVAVPAVIVAEAFAGPMTSILEGARRERSSGLVPAWLDRLAQWSWRGLVVFAVAGIAIAAAVSVPGVTVPLVMSMVLAATLMPAVDALRDRGMGRGQAALFVTLSGAIVTVAVAATAAIAIGGYAVDITSTAEAGAQQANAALGDAVAVVGSGLVSGVVVIFSDVVGIAVATLLALLLTFHMLRDGPVWWPSVLATIPGRRRELLGEAVRRSGGILNGYMVGTGAISLFAAVTQWLIMVLLGLPLAFPVAVLTFFGNFIPYIGGAVTTFIGFLVAVAAGSPTDIVIMAIYTLVINIVQGNFVAPLVYGRTVSLHPAIVLLAIPAGGQIAGIIGMFLVVPFLGVVATTWRLVLHLFDPDDAPSPLIPTDPDPLLDPSAAPAPTAAGP